MMNFSGNINIHINEKEYKSQENDSKKASPIKKQKIEEPPPPISKISNPTRCAKCNKKLKLSAIKCRCDQYFCTAHRYSDLHDCPFDYKKHGKKILEKQNPLIAADKIDKL